MRIAIHQPNFVPWLPFFQKMAAVDVFVILTECQFCRTAYQHRFRHEDRWYSMNVARSGHRQDLKECRYLDPGNAWTRIKRQLPTAAAWLSQFDDCLDESLVTMNTTIIRRMAQQLGITTRIELDHPTTLSSTDRMIDICQRHGGRVYLAGSGGSHEYLEVDKFRAVGIDVEFQDPEKLDRRHAFQARQTSV